MKTINHFFACMQSLLQIRTYSSDLESYITSRHPKSAADVEKYTQEYNRKISQGK